MIKYGTEIDPQIFKKKIKEEITETIAITSEKTQNVTEKDSVNISNVQINQQVNHAVVENSSNLQLLDVLYQKNKLAVLISGLAIFSIVAGYIVSSPFSRNTNNVENTVQAAEKLLALSSSEQYMVSGESDVLDFLKSYNPQFFSSDQMKMDFWKASKNNSIDFVNTGISDVSMGISYLSNSSVVTDRANLSKMMVSFIQVDNLNKLKLEFPSLNQNKLLAMTKLLATKFGVALKDVKVERINQSFNDGYSFVIDNIQSKLYPQFIDKSKIVLPSVPMGSINDYFNPIGIGSSPFLPYISPISSTVKTVKDQPNVPAINIEKQDNKVKVLENNNSGLSGKTFDELSKSMAPPTEQEMKVLIKQLDSLKTQIPKN